MSLSHCRFCKKPLHLEFLDLIAAPPSNSFLKPEDLSKPETYYPLKLYVCNSCLLVQVDEHKSAHEIFDEDYVYFSSYSQSWLQHCNQYVDQITDRLRLDSSSLVAEIASNDGYLLQYFKAKAIPNFGIEPTYSTAEAARKKGIDTEGCFFGKKTAIQLKEKRGAADLLIANNVLAHVPDLHDFVGGFKILLAPSGTATIEFPHLLQLVREKQFDTVYHEHFSYFSLLTICNIFRHHDMRVYDVEQLPTHGGSLRIYVDHGSSHEISSSVEQVLEQERAAGMASLDFYKGFQEVANQVKFDFLMFLLQARKDGKRIAAYGAAAKGNTFLNYCGLKSDLIDFVVDASPHKQGRFLPGSHIPVTSEEKLRTEKPDYIVILPWNLRQEISSQLSYVKEWGGKFIVAIPRIESF